MRVGHAETFTGASERLALASLYTRAEVSAEAQARRDCGSQLDELSVDYTPKGLINLHLAIQHPLKIQPVDLRVLLAVTRGSLPKRSFAFDKPRIIALSPDARQMVSRPREHGLESVAKHGEAAVEDVERDLLVLQPNLVLMANSRTCCIRRSSRWSGPESRLR